MSGLFGLAFAPAANAVVAKPGINTTIQPDGTTVSIRLEGDAFNHRAYTSDGYLLTTDADGYYVFATVGQDGMPVSSGIRALDPEHRTAEIVKAISLLDQSGISDSFTLRDEALRQAKSPLKGPGLYSSHYPSKGEQKALAILVNFTNKEFSMENAQEYYTRQLNEEGFSDHGATGSARDFFVGNSYGQFQPTFDVYGPVTLGHPFSYYGANNTWGSDKRAHEMVIEACQLLDDEIDFSQYDRNGDGVIDNVYIYYAGYGEADGGGSNTVWPHSYDITSAVPNEEYIFDGVRLDHYACSNELEHARNIPTGIGTFTHEFSHVMGLPDLYATDNSNAFTPGEWNILDVGSYNNNSCTPPNYSSFERYALDWMEPEEITKPGEYELDHIMDSNKSYMIRTENPDEYFLIENRQHRDNDLFIPGHGMLVWHVDFVQQIWDYNIVNNNNRHQYVDLVEADNMRTNTTRSGDSFPGANGVTEFTAETKPALVSWKKASPGLHIIDIKETEDGRITFRVVDNLTGVEEIDAMPGGNIEVCGNKVSCSSGTAEIYNMSGLKVAEAGVVPVELQPGMYVISSAGERIKVIVK